MKPKSMAALVTSAALLWGTAHAAPEAETPGQPPGVIILEMQPGVPGMDLNNEQAILGMILLQLLTGMQAQGEAAVQESPPPVGQSI